MSGRILAAHLIVAAMLAGGWAMPARSAPVDCSLPVGELTAAQFAGCLRSTRDEARIIPLRIGEFEYVAPKPTTQRAYDALLHAGD